MEALVVGCDIYIDNIPILQWPLIRNAMADHLQYRTNCCCVSIFRRLSLLFPQEQLKKRRKTTGGTGLKPLTSFTEVQTDFGKLP